MTRTLIAYYSRTGTAARVADQLHALTRWPLVEVCDLRSRSGLPGDVRCIVDSLFQRRPHYETHGADLAGCTHLVVIAPIWMGQLASPMRSLLHDLLGAGRQSGIASVSLICVMARQGAFNAAIEVQTISGMLPRPMLALRQSEVLDGSAVASLMGFAAEHSGAFQGERQAWLSPEAS